MPHEPTPTPPMSHLVRMISTGRDERAVETSYGGQFSAHHRAAHTYSQSQPLRKQIIKKLRLDILAEMGRFCYEVATETQKRHPSL